MATPASSVPERRLLPAGLLSLLVHSCFVLLLVYTVQWQNHAPAGAQAELWTELPPTTAANPPPVPDPQPEVTDTPAPETAPEPVAPPPRPKAADIPQPVKPDIAIEKQLVKPVDKPVKPTPPVDTEKDRMAREEAELKKLDRDLRAKQAAQKQQELAEDRRQAQLLRDAEAREKAAAQAARAAVGKTAQDRIIAKINGNIIAPPSVPSGISTAVTFVLLPDGSVLDGSIHIVTGSGNSAYDEAVQRAIVVSQPLPMPDDPALRRQLRDLKLIIQHHS